MNINHNATIYQNVCVFNVIKDEIGCDGLPRRPVVIVNRNETIVWDSMYGEVRAIQRNIK